MDATEQFWEKPEAVIELRVIFMLKAISVTSVFVLDKDVALDFYVGKLGLEVAQDVQSGPTRWLTVRVPGVPSLEVFLEEPGPPAMDEATTEQVRELISKGATGFGLAFTTDDCRKTYEELRAKGVEFTQEPSDHFYGTDMGLRDPFGNSIRILQPANGRAAQA